jgi:hypothetical protein
MVEWRFADAETEIADAGEWLVGRDALLAEIEDAELTTPDRLRAAYEVHGGGPPAWAEIDAERALVEVYVRESETIAAGLDPIARVGFLFGPGPEERRAAAATAFAAGELGLAADELEALHQGLATATAGGLARLLGVIVAVLAGALLVTLAIRRRRTSTNDTPEP